MTEPQETDRADQASAALRVIADAIHGGIMPIPSSVDVWHQYVSATQLLSIADHNDKPIRITEKHAATRITLGDRDTNGGMRVEIHYMVMNPADEALRMFIAHNNECNVAAGS